MYNIEGVGILSVRNYALLIGYWTLENFPISRKVKLIKHKYYRIYRNKFTKEDDTYIINQGPLLTTETP